MKPLGEAELEAAGTGKEPWEEGSGSGIPSLQPGQPSPQDTTHMAEVARRNAEPLPTAL